MNEKKVVCTIFLDVAKAFECVDRKLLLLKLEQLGIRGKSLNIFESYINDREQFVQIKDYKSTIKCTKFGVAQGLKLGPLLFLVFINDFLRVELNGQLQLYADDSSVTYIANNYAEIYDIINEDLPKIAEWFKNNLLVLHADKSKISYYNPNDNEVSDIILNGCKIEQVNETKYVGLIIDSNLNWNSHIDNLMKKIRPYVGVFRRISFLCDKVKKMMYYSYFNSNSIYLLSVGSGTKNENIDKLEKLQNECLRNLFHNKYKIGNIITDDLYKEYDIIKFKNMIDLDLKVNFHKIINNFLKADIDIEKNNNFHEHETRQAKNLRKIKSKNSWGKLSITNRGINADNSIPSPIKN